MKKSRFILVLTLLAAFLVGAVTAAVVVLTAPGPTLVYDGETGEFILENVKGSDLFPNFKNLMPGDVRTQDINLEIKNIQTPTTLYLTSIPDEAAKKALEPLTISATQDGAELGEFAHSALEGVPLGVFRSPGSATLHVKLSVPTSVGNEFQNAQGSLRWDFSARHTITITPASISSYVGGVSSNDSGAPTLRFHVTLPNHVIWDNDRSITMTLHEAGREPITMTPRKVEGSESYYCFPTLERGLEFVEGSQVLKGDYLTLTNRLDSGSRGGAYTVGLNQDPAWYITAVGESGREYAVEVLTGDAQVYVRYVSSDAEMIDAPSSALTMVVSDPAKVNTIVDAGEHGIYRKAVAVIDKDAVYYTNGKSSGLGSFTMDKNQDGDIGGLKPLVALLFDDTVSLSDDLTDKLIEAKMIEHAGHAKSCGADRNYSFDGWSYNFRYLDLVNYNDGNAWVSTDAETTIYWPYPIQALNDPGGYTSYEYQILHYQGMTRRVTQVQDIDQWEKETLHREDGAVKVYSEDLTLTPKGLCFTLENIEGSEDNFSPFVLMWRKKTTGGHGGGGHGGGGGGGGTPSPAPEPTPSTLLDRDNHYDYIVGFPDGTVRPEAPITRAETATIFFRLLTDKARETYLAEAGYHVFDDVAQDAWYATTVNTLNRMGIILGRTPTLFAPEANITRAEFATLAARFSDGKGNRSVTFTDIHGHWAEGYIQKAAAEGWVVGYEDGTFRPDDLITRAEAMTLINRVLLRVPERTGDLAGGVAQWPDNAPGAWYYLAVQEATHHHSYTRKGTTGEQWTALLPGKDWLIYQ